MRAFNSLVFFLPFLVGEGAGASVSGAAYTLVITGAVTSASENVASVKSRIANLLMHRSCWVVRGLGRETLPASVNQTSARRLFGGGLEVSGIPRFGCRPKRRSGSNDIAPGRGYPVRPATIRNTARS